MMFIPEKKTSSLYQKQECVTLIVYHQENGQVAIMSNKVLYRMLYQ